MDGISKSQVSRLCEDIDTRVNAFLERPLEGDWPYMWIDVKWLGLFGQVNRFYKWMTAGFTPQPGLVGAG
jgi:transposase-like protein